MNKQLDAALAYAKRGWPIFPCRADKTPHTRYGVHDATTHAKQIKEWWDKWPNANIALDVGGAGMMVLDLDPGHDWDEIEESIGEVPETRLVARTPRGGEHLYFQLDEGEEVHLSTSKIAPNVDVRSFSSYVLLPPGKTKDGKYEWVDEGKPSYRTDKMVAVANDRRPQSKDHDTWLIEPDMEENVTLATAWLKTDAKIAVDGEAGGYMALATAAMMKSFAISEELAFDLMWEHWNPRCVPPWDNDELEHFEQRIENAYKYNTSAPGNMTPAYRVAKTKAHFSPVTVELGTKGGKQSSAGRFRVVDRAGIAEIKPPEWLIPDFLTDDGYSMIAGHYGTFKTFVALDIALSVACGGVKPAWPPSPLGEARFWPDVSVTGPVLYTAGEGRSDVAQRIKGWEKVHNDSTLSDQFYLGDPVPMISEELDPFLEAALKLSPDGYALVVLDTVGRSMQGHNENSQEHASAFTHLVEILQRELDAAVLVLHHSGHDATDRPRGSSAFGGDLDTLVIATRENKENTVKLTMSKQKSAPEWKSPRFVAMREIALSRLDDKTLVAVNPGKNDNQKRDDTTAIGQNMVALNEAAWQILERKPMHAHTTLELADAMACLKNVDIGGSQLRNKWLRIIRENRTQYNAGICYDIDTRKWRFQGD